MSEILQIASCCCFSSLLVQYVIRIILSNGERCFSNSVRWAICVRIPGHVSEMSIFWAPAATDS